MKTPSQTRARQGAPRRSSIKGLAAMVLSLGLGLLPAVSHAEDCTTVLARVDAKLAPFGAETPGTVFAAKMQRDKGARHCQLGESAQALDALRDAEAILDRVSTGG